MIIKPTTHPKNEPRVTFYRTGLIVFNSKSIEKLKLNSQKKLWFEFDADFLGCIIIENERGFSLSQRNKNGNSYKTYSRKVFKEIDEQYLGNKGKIISSISFLVSDYDLESESFWFIPDSLIQL